MLNKKNPQKALILHVVMVNEKPHTRHKKYIHFNVQEYYREHDQLVVCELKSRREYRYSIINVHEVRVREAIEGQYWKYPSK